MSLRSSICASCSNWPRASNLTHLTRDKRLERRIVEEPIKNSNGFYKMRFECQRVSTFFLYVHLATVAFRRKFCIIFFLTPSLQEGK